MALQPLIMSAIQARIAERQRQLTLGRSPVEDLPALASLAVPTIPETGKPSPAGATANRALILALKRDAITRLAGRSAYEYLGWRRQASADFLRGKNAILHLRINT